MSTVLEHSTNASAIVQYKGKGRRVKTPSWIRHKQLESYYKSMSRFYFDCLEELVLPKRFDKEGVHQNLMANLRNMIRKDGDFSSLIIRLIENYPRFPMDSKTASEYIIALKNVSARVASAGLKLNKEIAFDSLLSNIPFVVFSNLYLGNYTISCFHEYKAKVTEQHFRHNRLLTRGRPHLRNRKNSIDNYFRMIKPIEEQFKVFMKSQFKLWFFITLSNSENMKHFTEKIQILEVDKVNQEHLTLLESEHETTLEEMRRQLFDLEPSLFNPTITPHEPTEIMWKDMVLVRTSE